VRALRVTRWHQEAALVEVDEPIAGPGQVVIRVGGAGLCHSDLHMMQGDPDTPPPLPVPFTLGHENAGWVARVGQGVTSVQLGESVAVHGAWGCGSCARCVLGIDNYCDENLPAAGGGLGRDGGLAEYMLVPHARYLLPLPDGLTPAQAAPLTDAGLTPFHAVKRSLPKLDTTAWALIIGVGGLGHMAIQILKATTAARVIAVDTRQEALDLAASLGADVVLEAGDAVASQVRTATKGLGADVVLDCVGTDETLRTAVASARTLGDVTLVGVAGGSVPFGYLGVPREVSLQTVYWGSRSELREVLELASRGFLRPETTTFSLDQALNAYSALDRGELLGRAVVTPSTSA
jgi:alcohol dehydrogenase, propanol-preferring